MSDNQNRTLIEVSGLNMHFPVKAGPFTEAKLVRAIDNVSLEIPKKSVFGLVGESGSGKTTMGRCILRLLQPTAGEVRYEGTDVLSLSHKDMLTYRRKMQLVPQDPYNSLHPRKLVKGIIGEGLTIHTDMHSTEIYEEVKQILQKVGLKEEHMFRYPHEFSGGQRQRISVARALVLKPEFIVLDEPTSALDVSVQAVILKLLRDLRDEFDLTYVFITHDLAVIDYMADYVAVMYLGQIMEVGSKADIFERPAYPYTRVLLDSVLHPDPTRKQEHSPPKGEIPSPVNPPPGCRFHTRCPMVHDKCHTDEPDMVEVGPGHWAKCHKPLS
jgi:oligopeptide/dipeptide ABC transporter ATP-binding protein